jgi:protease-4
MPRRSLLALALLAGSLGPIAWTAPAAAQEALGSYTEESDLLATTPSTDPGAVGAMFNPAQWGATDRAELAFFWSDADARPHAMDNWGFAVGRGLGLSFRRHDFRTPTGPRNWNEWQIGAGGGRGAHYGGIAFGFSGAGKGLLERRNYIALGDIARPARWLSVGTTTQFALGNDDIQGVADVGVRPLGTPRVLLFTDYALRRRQHWDGGDLAGGIALRPVDGLDAALKLREGGALQLAFSVTLGRAGVRAIPRYDRDGTLAETHYVVRANPPVRGLDWEGKLLRNRRFLTLPLKGRATYQSYRFLDEGSRPLRDITGAIQDAIDDPTVAGVAVDLSGFEADPAMIWEVREKLLALRKAGKHCVVYADQLDLLRFYLATAADRIVLDPQTLSLFPGVQASRTYLKDAMAKLGLGFEEWRYFKYKSAMETLSRTNMSEADREQWTGYVRESYDEYAAGIVGSGRATRAQLDSVVNREVYVSAKRMVELGWADTIGHWEDVRGIAGTLAGHRVVLATRSELSMQRPEPNEDWGAPPTIALVYAVGDCAMDTGIRGRETSRALRAFRKDREVRAVVVRADSPGGEVLPSDLVAHEMAKLREAGKPVLVSQGRVAASGGYWISMEANRISTTPFTLTGSIGVIGGWVWDEGFGKKLGLTADHVQVGRSADLMGGLRLPLFGTRIPERNLDAQEQADAKRLIFDYYDEFVGKVAKARGLPEARVRELAQGRIWMGRAAEERKLVDRVATLDQTLDEAKREAGIPPGRRVRIIEYPKRGLIRWPSILSGGFSTAAGAAAAEGGSPRTLEATVVQDILDHPGAPLLLAPAEALPDEPAPVR